MAKFSFHCQCYKKENLAGIDRHNRRKNKNYGNKDIDIGRSKDNRVYITPDTTLYQACKKQIEDRVLANSGRVTKASNWICECIFSYPDELPLDRMDDYYSLVIDYIADKLSRKNIIEAVVHMDEGGLPHLHLDVLTITEDNRLSSKNLITRDFIMAVHNELPIILRKNGFDIERGTAEHTTAGLDAREYKKRMDKEAAALDERLNSLTDEYNNLVDEYNELVHSKKLLEQNNLNKAREIVNARQIIR